MVTNPHFPCNRDSTDFFLEEDVRKIMAKYKEFLLDFDAADRTLHYSQVVQAQLMALLVRDYPDTFFSLSEEKIKTACHPKYLLNRKYRNEHTQSHAKRWDLVVYTLVCTYLLGDDQIECTEANNIIEETGGSTAFELLICAAVERNKRNSEHQSKREGWCASIPKAREGDAQGTWN